MNEFVRQLCKQNIEPSIVEKIKGFQFDRLVLGRIVSFF